MKSTLATAGLIALLASGWATAQTMTAPNQALAKNALQAISDESATALECAKLANAIHSTTPPKDHELYLKAVGGATAAKKLGLTPPVVEPVAANVSYETQLRQQVATFAQCGQRYQRARPGTAAAREWLFKHVQEKDVDLLKQLAPALLSNQQAQQKLAVEMNGLSKNKIHQQAVNDTLQKYFLDAQKK